MIKLPDLDDQRYADIVEAAKRRIPVIFPEWTDLNEHDPGITMIELFAWLKEMQQYYLNRISDRCRENMMRLLGIECLPAAPSKVSISFDNEAPKRLARGTSFFSIGGVEFVNEDEYSAAPFKLGKMFSDNNGVFTDLTKTLSDVSSTFYPFGRMLNSDNRYLYIEIAEINDERFYDGAEIFFDITDEFEIHRNAPNESVPPPREIVWEYSSENGFVPCEVLKDATYSLSFSGALTLKIGRDLKSCSVKGLTEGKWIRAQITKCGCEDMPGLNRIYCGALGLVQKTRLSVSEDIELDGRTIIEAEDMLAQRGSCFVFLKDESGWYYDGSVSVSKTDTGVKLDLSNSEISECSELKLVICEEYFGNNLMFFSSNGLPCQEFDFDPNETVLCGELSIMVKDRESDPKPRWREYKYIESFSLAGAYDRCFTYDEKRRVLIFGDNEHGEVPPPGDENIMVVSCSVTKAADGNISAGSFKELNAFGKTYKINSGADSFGGHKKESITQAMKRVRSAVDSHRRAVTVEDYRTAALETPGLKIADAKAIPFFDLDLPAELSQKKSENTVTVVVMPYSSERFPTPDERFICAVRDHLEKYRLINTRIVIATPIYIRVNISTEVVCLTQETEKVCRRIKEVLENMFSVRGLNRKTRFGEPIAESDITACICEVDDILSVKHLNVSVSDKRCGTDRYGRIVIPPNAVTYCGSVDIRISDS